MTERTLLPEPTQVPAGEPERTQTLNDFLAYPDQGQWVRAVMVSSLDGAAVDVSGRSGSLGGALDTELFARMRSLADAVVVGAGTARAEEYGPPDCSTPAVQQRRTRGQTPQPALLIVSGSGQLPTNTGLAQSQSAVHCVLGSDADSSVAQSWARANSNIHVHRCESTRVTGSALQAILDAFEYRHVQCEGGPHLLGQLVAEGFIDEVCLSLAGVSLGGDATRIMHGNAHHRRSSLTHALTDGSLFFSRWRYKVNDS